MSTTTLFSRMERVANSYLKNYQSDFSLDKERIARNPNRSFVWLVRPNGTWLWLYPEKIEHIREDFNFTQLLNLSDGSEKFPISVIAIRDRKDYYGDDAKLFFYDRKSDQLFHLNDDAFEKVEMIATIVRYCKFYIESFFNSGKSVVDEYIHDLHSWAKKKGYEISSEKFEYSRKAELHWLGGITIYYNEDSTKIWYKLPAEMGLAV